MGYDRVDFKQLKGWLSSLKTEKEVSDERDKFLNEHKNLTEKQVAAISRIFAERQDQIYVKESGGEYLETPEDKEYAKKEGWILED